MALLIAFLLCVTSQAFAAASFRDDPPVAEPKRGEEKPRPTPRRSNPSAPRSSVVHFGNHFSAEAEAFLSRLEGKEIANGSRADFKSNLAFSIDLTRRYKVISGFGILFTGGFTKLDFKEPALRTIPDKSLFLLRASAGTEFKLTDRWRLGVLFGVGQEAYYYADSSLALHFDSTLVPKINGVLTYDIWEYRKFAVYGQARGAALAAKQGDLYNTEFGIGAQARLYGVYAPSLFVQWRLGFFYGMQSQGTNTIDIRRSDCGASLMFTKLLGAPQ